MSYSAQDIIDFRDKLLDRRSANDWLYEDISFFCLPDTQRWNGDQQTSSGRERPLTTVGIDCGSVLASGLFSNTYQSGTDWFALRVLPDELNQDEMVERFCGDRARAVLKAIQNSNFASQAAMCFRKLVTFGTGILYVDLPQNQRSLRFREYSIRDCAIEQDFAGNVNELYRTFDITAAQAVAEYGEESLPAEISKCAADPSRARETFEFIHAALPNPDGIKGHADPKKRPYWKYVIAVKDKQVVEEGGYYEFPYLVPRYRRHGALPEGESPAFDALGHLTSLERMYTDLFDVVEFAARPPVGLPDDHVKEVRDLEPGDVFYYNSETGGRPIVVNNSGDGKSLSETIVNREEQVRQLFHHDLFKMLEQIQSSGQRTAYEVEQLISEKIQLLSPVLTALNSEFYSPLVLRCMALMERDMQIPPATSIQSLGAKRWDIAYTTRLDARLSQTENLSILRTIGQCSEAEAALANAPRVALRIDMDKVVATIAHNNNAPSEILRTEDQVRAMEKRIQQERQQMMEREERMEATKRIAPVDTQRMAERGSPADRMMNG